MSYWQLVFALLMLLLASCQSGEEEAPQEPLPLQQEQLVSILVDVQLAEAALKAYKPETRDSLSRVYYERIAHLHGVSREEILRWLEEVNDDPKLMEEVYKQVLEELNRRDALDHSE